MKSTGNTPHHRDSIRLREYDYSRAGRYFITICAQNRKRLFGEIVDGQMVLNEYGKIVETEWNDLPNHYARVELDRHVVMPNHFHGIVVIAEYIADNLAKWAIDRLNGGEGNRIMEETAVYDVQESYTDEKPMPCPEFGALDDIQPQGG